MSGNVPHALISPLIKKANLDQNELKNYRPVSNLPFLSKLLEKAVVQQRNSHLEKYNLLEKHNQHTERNIIQKQLLLKLRMIF